jgi:hypothetical protein
MKHLEPLLWISDARGLSIPRDFANCFISLVERYRRVDGVEDDQWRILEEGPDNSEYWKCWDEVLRDAVITDDNGVKWTLYQDGDLWLIPEGMVWSEDNDFFVWPDDSELEPRTAAGSLD